MQQFQQAVSQDHVWLYTCPAVTSTIVATLCHVSKEWPVNCLCLHNEGLLMWMSHRTTACWLAYIQHLLTWNWVLQNGLYRLTVQRNAFGHLPDEGSLCLARYTGRKATLHILYLNKFVNYYTIQNINMKYLTICNATSAPQYSFDHSKSMTAILVQHSACNITTCWYSVHRLTCGTSSWPDRAQQNNLYNMWLQTACSVKCIYGNRPVSINITSP